MILSDGIMDCTRQITTAIPISGECDAVLMVVKTDEGMAVVQSLKGEVLMTQEEAKTVVINLLVDIVNRLTTIPQVEL